MNLTKQKYYVSVQARSILPNQGDAGYEFEIEATDTEVSKLHELFDEKRSADEASFFRAPIPFIQYHDDQENDIHDDIMKDIYAYIYEIGTSETKHHIDQMQILD